MKLITPNSNDNLQCPRNGKIVSLTDCRMCEDCFGIQAISYAVLCKRGIKKDEFIAKTGNRKNGK